MEVDDLFQIGDKIVYPMHGAGIIEAIEEKEILGTSRQYCVIRIISKDMQVTPDGSIKNQVFVISLIEVR